MKNEIREYLNRELDYNLSKMASNEDHIEMYNSEIDKNYENWSEGTIEAYEKRNQELEEELDEIVKTIRYLRNLLAIKY